MGKWFLLIFCWGLNCETRRLLTWVDSGTLSMILPHHIDLFDCVAIGTKRSGRIYLIPYT